jgi:nitronate monooxygenase
MGLSLDELPEPIVLAPLGGGPSTPALAAAVCNAGGLGQLASGYTKAAATEEAIHALRSMTDRPFGVNLFVPSPAGTEERALEAYVEEVRAEAEKAGGPLGEPRWDDDDWDAKLALVAAERVPVVSFTFGCPSEEVVGRLREAGCSVWVTVSDPDDARPAALAGADALVVQGVEAGGHRSTFVDRDGAGDLGLLVLLRLVRSEVGLPLVAAGGIADGYGIAAVLAAGAAAAQLGTAFMRAAEAGTSPAHREALAAGGRTALTRAFTGRQARGIVNRFMVEHSARAPAAYPQVHHLTAPLRAHARRQGDRDLVNLWAGQAFALAREEPAAETVARLGREWRQAVRELEERLGGRLRPA